MAINPPLYLNVKRSLQAQLQSGDIAPGDALPNEAALAQAHGVSIGTLRRAVDELVAEHVLVRRQGKGTFALEHNQARFMFQFFHVEPRWEPSASPFNVPAASAEFPAVRLLSFARAKASAYEAAALRLRPGQSVFKIENALSLQGKAVMHDQLVLPATLFAGLTEKRFAERSSTIYALYQAEFGVSVLRAEERARAVPASAESARVLGLRVGLPVLEVHRLALSFADAPVELRMSTLNTAAHDYVSVRAKTP
jgi:GntR family transcriptional regulator